MEHDRSFIRDMIAWEGITMDGRTSLDIFDSGSITGKRHRGEVEETI